MRVRMVLWTLLLTVGLAPPARALTLTQVDQSTPWPGVVITQYRTSSPSADVWVAEIDLCADHIRVEATHTPTAYRTAASWGASVGVQVATNGDFYRTGPQVYGDAIGGGIQWPLDQTGLDPAYSSDWFYKDYGWIAFGHDWVDYTHTKWVKNHASNYGTLGGYEPGTVAPPPPLGTLALVSGFPELVIEGEVYTCSSPTDSSCFPDRSDMRDRHPRTAMGLTADRQTFLLVVVDGRTSTSSGMYGAELADLMGQLGAYVAFNLDGGGSSQMWVDGDGTINNASGNNLGNGLRGVANHWGVFAGAAGGMPQRPEHCVSSTPCHTIPPPGDILESDGPCAWLFGDPQYWREESVGYGDHLYWTNAFTSDEPGNWAGWQLDFEQAGEYLLEVWVDDTFGVYDNARYQVVADGQSSTVHVDQGAAAGWTEVGTYHFAQGGGQYLAVFDNVSGSVASDQHIVADAIQLTRVDAYCGDGTCDAGEDCFGCAADCPPVTEIPGNGIDDDCDGEIDEVTNPTDPDAGVDPTGDASVVVTADASPSGGGSKGGCGCAAGRPAPEAALPWIGLLLLGLCWRRRARRPR